MAKRKFKRVLFGADMHCGHRVGLTPPECFRGGGDKYDRIRRETWKHYTETIDALKPIDYYIINGDCIDGSGSRSGGTEIIQPEIKKQREMAVAAILYADADVVRMTRGTDYHTAPGYQDSEDEIAKDVGAKIGDHEWYDINGVVFDVKHHVGNSSVPTGKGTAISKEWLHNMIWADYEDQPRADVIIRSHVHWFFYCGDSQWLGIYTPALQAMGSKYGARRCSQHVDFGLIHFDVYENGRYSWDRHILPVVSQKAKAEKL